MSDKRGDEWGTPQELFDKLNKEFSFDLDAAASEENYKVDVYLTKKVDAISFDWVAHSVWLNPPYSRGNIERFMKKAWEESLKGCVVVCLVRFDPSTDWYGDWVHNKAKEVRMLARRPVFDGADSGYPFPCCVVVYTPSHSQGVKTAEKMQAYAPYLETRYIRWDWID